MSFIYKYQYSFFKLPFINVGINEENIIENFVCFIYGGAGAGPLHQPRLRPKSTGTVLAPTGSATLLLNSDFVLLHLIYYLLPHATRMRN